jgi:hypothetical protein
MSKRGYWFLIAVVTVATLGARFIGEWVRLTMLVGMALVGIGLTSWVEYKKWRITRMLGSKSEDEQDARLVWVEDWADRPEILGNLDRRGPTVPLRSERERFIHAGHHLTVIRWTFWATAVLVLIFVYVAIARPPTDRSEWPYLIALIAGFGASLAYLPSQIRLYSEAIEVTDSALEVIRSNGRRDVIPWATVESVRTSALMSTLVIRASAGVVRIPHIIGDYGRLANLIATRLPATVAWRSV